MVFCISGGIFPEFWLWVLCFFSISSYYVNGRSATRADFLSPKVLDTFATAVLKVLEVPCPVQSFLCSVSQGVSRESRIKYNFLLAINRDPQSLGAAVIVNKTKKK